MASASTTETSTDALAFNVNLIAYDFKFPDRIQQQTLVASKLHKSTGTLAARFEEGFFTSPLEPTPAELDTELGAGVETLWVGVWFPAAPEYTTPALNKKSVDVGEDGKAAKKKSGYGKRGAKIDDGAEYTLASYDPKTVRVVAPFGKKTANYYGLINQKEATGLCEGVHVPIEEVFFFSEYRDDELSTKQLRKSGWSKKVREFIQVDVNEQVDTFELATSSDTSPLDVQPEKSTAAEVVALIASYSETKDLGFLEKTSDLIKGVRSEAAFSAGGNTLLLKLACGNEQLTEQESNEAYEEFCAMAPDIRTLPVKPIHLYIAAQGLRFARLTLEPGQIREFVVRIARRIESDGGDTMWASDLAQQTLEDFKALPGPATTTEPSTTGSFGADMLTAISDFIRAQGVGLDS